MGVTQKVELRFGAMISPQEVHTLKCDEHTRAMMLMLLREIAESEEFEAWRDEAWDEIDLDGETICITEDGYRNGIWLSVETAFFRPTTLSGRYGAVGCITPADVNQRKGEGSGRAGTCLAEGNRAPELGNQACWVVRDRLPVLMGFSHD